MYMENFTNEDIEILLSGLCCSRCKNDFTYDSIKIKQNQGNVYICKLICQKCGKDFGDIVLNYNKISNKHDKLEIVDGGAPISYDDVIEAHEFIKKHL